MSTYFWNYDISSSTTSNDYYVYTTADYIIIDDVIDKAKEVDTDPFDDELEDDNMYCERIGI